MVLYEVSFKYYLETLFSSCKVWQLQRRDKGPIFLRRFRLYVLSFILRFMFANICFEKNQNNKIHFMFITKRNMKWNMKNQVLPSASCTSDKLQTYKTIFGISCKFLSNNSIQMITCFEVQQLKLLVEEKSLNLSWQTNKFLV